jgi:hypothetical protein
MTRYWSGLVPLDIDLYSKGPFHGKCWTVEFIEPFHNEYRIYTEPKESDKPSGYPVVISAQKRERAFVAASLIAASLSVVDAISLEFYGRWLFYPPLYTHEEWIKNRSDVEWKAQHSNCIGAGGIIAACMLATRASFRRRCVYAIHRLSESYRTFSMSRRELDPEYFVRIPQSPFPNDHVRWATAIVLAYQTIEDLGLNIPTGERSRVKDEWNPKIRKKVENNLERVGIDPEREVVWHLRGHISKIEKGRPTIPLQVAPWSGGVVRDQLVRLVDALADISFLRSRIAAHSNDVHLGALTPFDVANAQSLARLLLIAKYDIDIIFKEAAKRLNTTQSEL